MQFRKSLISLALTSTFLTTSPSFAAAEANAAADASAEAAIEKIAVTGQRIAYANNSTDEAMLDTVSPAGNVLDAIKYLPGVSVGQGDAFGADDWSTTISMRGFNVNLNEQQLGITIDGLPNGGSAYGGGSKANRYLDTENTASVEVAQGTADIASASLDALGGTLNFVSASPEAEAGVRAGITGGDHNARKYYTRYDTGQLFGNTTAYFSLSDGFNNRWIGSGSNGFAERTHFEAKSVTELEHSKITARFSYDDTAEDNYNTVSLADFAQNPTWDRLTSQWTGDPEIDQNFAETWSTLRENSFSYVKWEQELADETDLTVTPYLHLQSGRGDWLPPYQVYVTDKDGKRVNKGTGNGQLQRYTHVDAQGRPILDPKADLSKATRVASYRHTHYEKDRVGLTSELKMQLDNHQLRAGVWYEQQDRNETRDWHQVLDTKIYHYFNETPYWVHYDRDYSTDTLKLFAQDTVELGDLMLTAGVKQFYVDVERQDNIVSSNAGDLSSDSDPLWSFGAVYRLTDELEAFAGFSQNFKAIGDAILETSQDFSKLEAETADNIDFGLRYNADNLSLNLTLYSTTFDNRITFLQPGANQGAPDYLNELDGTYINVGGIDAKGIETSLNWQLNDVWSLYGALTLNDAVYNQTINGSIKQGNQTVKNPRGIFEDDQVAGAPETIVTVSARFNTDKYHGALTARHTAEYYGAALGGNKDELPASTVLDLSLGYQKTLSQDAMFQYVDLSLLVNNLTDEEYLSGGQEGAYYIGAGRTASFTVSLGF